MSTRFATSQKNSKNHSHHNQKQQQQQQQQQRQSPSKFISSTESILLPGDSAATGSGIDRGQGHDTEHRRRSVSSINDRIESLLTLGDQRADLPLQSEDLFRYENDYQELETTFETFRKICFEEALAIVQQQHLQQQQQPLRQQNGLEGDRGAIGSILLDISPPISYNGEDDTLLLPASNATSGGAANGSSPKRSKRVLSQLDVNELIQMKISQLESASSKEDDEEKVIAKVMKKMHKELAQVANGQDDHQGKISFMQRKYLEMFQDMRKQERDHLKLKKKFELLQREKDMVQREKDRVQQANEALTVERNQLLEGQHASTLQTTRADLLLRKMEGLCRQMYSDNKRVREDIVQGTDHISGTFEKAIVEFKDKVETEIAEKQRLIDANGTMLHEKFQGFLEQYEVREKHFNSVVRSKDLELQLAQAKLEQQRQVAQQESAKVELLKSQLNAFSNTEAELRKQLNVYVDKFMQVEETLNKSNSLFQTFRKEMEAMSKKGNSLERVNLAIRTKCDTMNRNILEMAEERTNHQRALEEASKKRIKLEHLCRTLHAERAALRKELDRFEALYPELKSSAVTTVSTLVVSSDGEGEMDAAMESEQSEGKVVSRKVLDKPEQPAPEVDQGDGDRGREGT